MYICTSDQLTGHLNWGWIPILELEARKAAQQESLSFQEFQPCKLAGHVCLATNGYMQVHLQSWKLLETPLICYAVH